MLLKQIVTYSIRGAESLFAVITLGLAAGYLGEVGFNDDRYTYCLVVAILNILYFAYILGIVPYVTNDQIPSLVILIGESLFAIFYLAGMGSIADRVSICDAYNGYRYLDDNTLCQLTRALIPFTLFNWLLFTADLVLFLFYSFIPEVKTYGWGHILQLTKYHFGAIWSDYAQSPLKAIAGVEQKGAADGTGATGEADAAAPVVGDEEAHIGSSDEEARETKYTEATSIEDGEDRPIQQQ